jgi:hypothetical protein
MARPRRPAIIPPENQVLRRKPGGQLIEKRLAFGGKDNVPGLPGFREPDDDRPGGCV